MLRHWPILLSSILISVSGSPWDFHFLIWVALVPFLLHLHQEVSKPSRNSPLKRLILVTFGMNFFCSMAIYWWIAPVVAHYGELPWAVGILCALLFSTIAQPQFVAAGHFFFKALEKRTALPFFQAALAYTFFDWIIPKLFQDTLGHTQHSFSTLLQSADIGGAHLLTFVIVMINLVIASSIIQIRSRVEPSLLPSLSRLKVPALCALGGLIFLLAYGSIMKKRYAENSSTPTFPIAVIQGNIGDFAKVAAERGIGRAAHEITNKMFTLTEQALKHPFNPKIVIWPETAYPSTFGRPNNPDEALRDKDIENFAKKNQIALLFGGYDTFRGKDFNALFFLKPDLTLDVYQKSILLWFGEYIPGMESGPLSFLKQYLPQIANFGRGPGPQALDVPTQDARFPLVKVSPVICYEALFPNYLLAGARQGAQMILNITNDSWFGQTPEPHWHLALSRFRSVETRLPQVRSTNTGISTLILPDGTYVQPTSLFQEATPVYLVPYIARPPLTPIRVLGDWFGPACGIALIALGLRSRKRKDI